MRTRRVIGATAATVVALTGLTMGLGSGTGSATGTVDEFSLPLPPGFSAEFPKVVCADGMQVADGIFEYADYSVGATTAAAAVSDPSFWARQSVDVDPASLTAGEATSSFAEFAWVDAAGRPSLVAHARRLASDGKPRGWVVDSLHVCNNLFGGAQ